MAADGDKMERTVSVSATGSVMAEADVAQISAGVVTEADSAKDAMGRNSIVMTKLIDGLKAAGIQPKDIQTTTLNVEPRYTQPKDGRAATINGYRVVNQVRLTVRDVKRLGEFLDQAIALGANQINHIAFDIAEPEMLKDEARKQAMENARRRGELYAKAAGGQLGPVLRISESVADAHPMPGGRMAMRASVPIEARHAQPRGRGARDLRPALSRTPCRPKSFSRSLRPACCSRLTPGPNMALMIANTLRHGLRGGLVTLAGTTTGLALLVAAAAAGMTSIMVFMSTWFDVVRWTGAVYLVYLGARQLWQLRGRGCPNRD